jgi:hypothetical protein
MGGLFSCQGGEPGCRQAGRGREGACHARLRSAIFLRLGPMPLLTGGCGIAKNQPGDRTR